MDLVRRLKALKPKHKGCVLSIGNFDGVHLGHCEILSHLISKSKDLKIPSTVMTFEPQPAEFFAGKNAPARLTRLRDKFIQLDKYTIDTLVCVKFTQDFANLSPERFIEEILVKKLNVKYLVVGDDFSFGYQRQGNYELLKKAGKKFGFKVVDTKSLIQNSHRVSSSLIRNALAQGHLEDAAEMLGRKYSISGRVSHGQKLGRTIGVPTANIFLKRLVSPVSGVFIVTILGIENKRYNGIANIGQRPTFKGKLQQLEVHIFDFKGDLYGSQLEVILEKKLREERSFSSFSLLKEQINEDIIQAKSWHLLNLCKPK